MSHSENDASNDLKRQHLEHNRDNATQNGGEPSNVTPPKKARSVPANFYQIVNSGSTRIESLKRHKTAHIELGVLRAGIVAISQKLEENEMVGKTRRRMVLVDTTGMMTGYVHVQPFTGKVGDVLL